MIDQAKASQLAKEAFDQWQAGRHEQARLLYEEAILLADPRYFLLPNYHGEYARVLKQLGRDELATTQLEKALETEIAQGALEGSPPVIVARYFLADHLLRLGEAERALETLAPSLIHAPGSWLTRLEEAHVLYALDRKAQARSAAELAVAYAPTPEKAEQLKQHLKEVLCHRDVQS